VTVRSFPLRAPYKTYLLICLSNSHCVLNKSYGRLKSRSGYYTVSGNKVNHTRYWIEMSNLNASQQNYVHGIQNIFLKEPQNYVRKYLLRVELLIFKNRRQNISVSVTLVSATPDFIANQLSWCQPSRLPDLSEAAEACVLQRLRDVAKLKSRLIEKWENFNQMINWSSMKQSRSDVHVFKLAYELMENILNTDFKYVWLLHFTVSCLNVANSGHFVFG